MTLQNQRLDITDRVEGKLCPTGFELFLEKEPIGKVEFAGDGNHFHLKEGFEYEDTKVYQHVQVPAKPDEKYVDCDYENGWC
ncbi:YusG family protein [Bacillus alkalisoli]|uniref:YusG family protein n=1 Tax=Bacillus alkalisoli TaxID=2011008 RepID=UPI000C24C59A|nr:YusG family protein [Bacillus alkalisoli]